MHWNDWSIAADSIKYPPQYISLKGCVAVEAVEHCNANTAKRGSLPCPYGHPNLSPTLLELNTAMSLGSDPPNDARKDAGVRPI